MTAKRSQLERTLVGAAGEHYVLHCLYLQGLLASLAPPGTPEVDILVYSDTEIQSVKALVQVKSRIKGPTVGWHIQEKHDHIESDRLFYAFVDFMPEGRPPVYVIPSRVVAATLRNSYAAWLAQPGKKGQAHHENKFRMLMPAWDFEVPGAPPGWMDEYLERWEMLVGEGR